MASNRSRRRVSQTEKRRARQGRHKQKSRVKAGLAMLGMGVLAILIIAGLALPSFGGSGASRHVTSETLADRPVGDAAPGTIIPSLGSNHFQGDTAPVGYYNSAPPTSGDHARTPTRCGIFNDPVPDEIQVHNLEHGFVAIQYNSEDATLVNRLTTAVQALPDWPSYYILAPYEKMEETIALTAWGVVQYLDAVDEPAMRAFADAYRGRGLEAGTPPC